MVPRSDGVAATVHVIDDDASVLRALRRLLQAAGFTVETFAGADAFLAATRASPPDCVRLQRLFKTGGRLIRHARYFILQLAESRLTKTLFR